MAKRNTSIQINGKRYDALSGALLNFEDTASPTPARAKSIDGVVGSKSRPAVASAAIKPVKAISRPVADPKSPVITRTVVQHAKPSRTKPSTTLMRHAVKKPQTSLKSRTKVVHPVKHASHAVVIPKTSLHGINHVRAARAAQYQMSPRVTKFAHEVSVAIATVKADVQETVTAIDNAIVIPQTYTPSGGTYRPDIRRVRVKTTQQMATSDIFEQALLRATSHEQEPVEPKLSKSRIRSLRRRMVSFSAGAVAVLSLVGFFGFQQQDTIQFRMAATGVGYSATMPKYQPTGYSLANIKTVNDTLFAKYANADNSYIISQRPTTWESQTLMNRLVEERGANSFVTSQADGRTIYMYGRNQAAWVHNGILYQVLGNSALNSTDFTRLATSM